MATLTNYFAVTSICGEEGDEGAEVVRGRHRGQAPAELGEHQHLPGLKQNSAKIDLWLLI